MPDEGIRPTGALDGLRIIELTDGAFDLCGKLLADMGADVVKVEPPGGGWSRGVGPFFEERPDPNLSLFFWYYNTNKRSVTLDPAQASGRAVFERLLASADVLIESTRPGTLAEMGLTPVGLRARYPRLVVCSITPYGQFGPWSQYRGSDLTDLAAGVPMHTCGYDDHGLPPMRGDGNQSVVPAAHFAVSAIMLALLHRLASGRGEAIDVAVHDALAVTVEEAFLWYAYNGELVQRQTNRHAKPFLTAPTQFLCKDGRYVVGSFFVTRHPTGWKAMREWMQSTGFAHPVVTDERFADPDYRESHLDEVLEGLRAFFAAQDSEDIYQAGQARGLAVGVVRNPEDVTRDPHLADRGFLVELQPGGVERAVIFPGHPYLFSATPWQIRRPPPRLGEHTHAILGEELGLSREEIVRLREVGAA